MGMKDNISEVADKLSEILWGKSKPSTPIYQWPNDIHFQSCKNYFEMFIWTFEQEVQRGYCMVSFISDRIVFKCLSFKQKRYATRIF